jgi:hypothetical protein
MLEGQEKGLVTVECALLAAIAVGWVLWKLTRWLSAGRPGIQLRWALGTAFAVRVLTAIVVSSSGSLSSLRGPDDPGFVTQAVTLGDTGGLGAWFDTLWGKIHVAVLAVPVRVLGNPGDLALRVLLIGFACAGIALAAAAVSDLAGTRSGTLAAWLLALEPSGVFFSQVVQKEPLMILAEGIVALGGARMWLRRDAKAGVALASGVALAIACRPYVGGFLLAASVALVLTASLRRLGTSRRRSRRLALVMVAVALLGAAVVLPQTTTLLNRLQTLQNSYVSSNANLKLRPIDFTTAGGLAEGIPSRMFDLVAKPYPWQMASTNQRFGALGAATTWLVLLGLLVAIVLRPRLAVQRLPPLAYAFVAVLVVYAMTSGNAGTGYRHRTHVLFFALAMIAVLLSPWLARFGVLAPRWQRRPEVRPMRLDEDEGSIVPAVQELPGGRRHVR